MKTINHLISIKTLTDYHLECYTRSPHQFFRQYVLKENSKEALWRKMVRFSVNQIIKNYYRLPLNEQNKLNLLKLIDQYWEAIHPGMFENKIHYYLITAKITDHLLLFLSSQRLKQPPVFLYESHKTTVEEIDTMVSVTIDVGEWSKNTFCIKKFLLEDDDSMTTLYKYLFVVFSKKAFGIIPDKIELFSLLGGKHQVIYPNEPDVEEGFIYLDYVKSHIENPNPVFN